MITQPEIGDTRQARDIDASMLFLPGQDHNGIPHDQNVDWLKQYPCLDGYSADHGYLVRCDPPGNESYPVEIWESRPTPVRPNNDLLDSIYALVWKRQPDPGTE